MRSLADLRKSEDTGGPGVPEDYLRMSEVVERLRAAGFPDSEATVRRDIDDGVFGPEGVDWYKRRSGYRYVKVEAVDRVIAERRGPIA